MKKILAFVCGLILFFQSAIVGFAQGGLGPDAYRYLDDVRALEQENIIPAGTSLEPNKHITRQEFAKWLLKNAGFSDEKYKPRRNEKLFTDVPVKKNPFAPFIYRLRDLGAFKTETNSSAQSAFFKPAAQISMKEALDWTFFVEGISVPKIFDEKNFAANNINVHAKVAPLIDKAISIGVLPAGPVDLYKKITRGEAAHFLKLAKNTVPTLTITVVPSVDSDLTKNPKFDTMLEAWNRIFKTYLHRDTLKRDELIYGATEGLLKELGDKHSNFERPGDNSIIDSLSGEIEGIGAVIQLKDDVVVIVTPIVGSPAEKAGLEPSDIITAVDTVSVKGLTLNQVVIRIKGKKGTQVKITVQRGTKTLDFLITRDVIKIISARVDFTDDNIAKITLADFGENTLREFKDVLNKIKQKNSQSIVIDLRNDPGGFLTTAVDIAGFFIKSGDLVTTVRYPDHDEKQFSRGKAELAGDKIIVLTNGGSASASEILAGALQDYGLAKVVGEKTYGKGTVQELSDFPDGSSLKLTVAEWLTPKLRSIEKNGITPDIEVKMTSEDRKAGRDPQMERALAELRKN